MAEPFVDVPIFVAVVEAGGFSAAARALQLSRSAVGKAVARLETRLSTRLFHRTTRRLSLTEDGQVYHEHCQRGLAEFRAGHALLETGRRAVRGKLRVSMPVVFGRRCVAGLLLRLTTDHPALELEMAFTDRLVDLLEDGFDLAIRMGPLGKGPGLMARRIAHERTSVFGSPAYLRQHGMPATIAELDRHHAITYGRSGRQQGWVITEQEQGMVEVRPPGRLRLDDLDAIADAAARGFGLAWLPTWLVHDRVASGELIAVLAHCPARVSDIHAVWPETPFLPLRVRVAIDTLAAGLPRVTAARQPEHSAGLAEAVGPGSCG